MGPRPADFDEQLVRQSPTYLKWSSLADGEKLRYACREFIKGHGDDDERLMRRIMIARRNNIRDHETLKKARRQSIQPLATTPNLSTATTTAANVVLDVAPPQALPNLQSTDEANSQTSPSSPPDQVMTIKMEIGQFPMEVSSISAAIGMAVGSESGDTTGATMTTTNVAAGNAVLLAGAGKNESTTAAAAALSTTLANTNATAATTRSRRPPHSFSDSQVEQEMDVAAVEKTRSYKTWMSLPEGSEFVVRCTN
jgi:hypothetical protein